MPAVRLILAIDGAIPRSHGLTDSRSRRLLQRSRFESGDSRCWEYNLLNLIFPGVNVSIAEIYRNGEVFPVEGKFCLRCDPVELIADRDALYVNSKNLNLNRQECGLLGDSLNRHFAPDGLRFYCHHPRRWYLGSDMDPQISSPHYADISEQHLAPDALFQGEGASRWRSLLNEIQMLLYDNPVNRKREAEDRPLISSLWPWGGGTPCSSISMQVFGGHPFARGLAQNTDQPLKEISHIAELRNCLSSNCNLWVLQGDELEGIHELFDCCAAMLHNNEIEELFIVSGPGYLQLNRKRYKQWWKKDKKMEQKIWQELLNAAP